MKEEKQIRALVKEPGKDAEERVITDNLRSCQGIVGGYIETVTLPGIKNVTVILNEEVKLNDLPCNIFVPEYEDIFVGTVVIAGISRGNLISLTDEQFEKARAYTAAHDARGYVRGFGEFEGVAVYSDSGENGKTPFYELLFGAPEPDGGSEM